jgi:hypothetical protein
MPWLTDKQDPAIAIELVNTADRCVYAGSFTGNEYDDAGSRFFRSG